MTIRPTIARVVIPASLPTLPLRAPDLKAPITPATKKQQPAEAEKPSRGFLDTLRDMLWHPRGIGQSSSVGKRYYTPDEIQEMTPEKLAEDERRKKMADAGLRAAAEGASAASGLLPANQGSAISGAATTVISDQVDRAVTRGSTVPNDEPADPTQPTPPKDQPTARPGNTTAPPDDRAADPPAPTTPPTTKPPADGGIRLRDDYIGIIDIDPDTLLPRRPTIPAPPPAPPKVDPPKPGKIIIRPARATDDANLRRELDTAGDELLRRGVILR